MRDKRPNDLSKVLEKLDTLSVWIIKANERLSNLENRISALEQTQANNHNQLNNRFSGMAKYLAEFKSSVLM